MESEKEMEVNRLNFVGNSMQSGINFGQKKKAETDYEKNLSRIDYSSFDTMDLKRSKTIPELSQAYKQGADISADREKLIYSRTKKAMQDAAAFVNRYPQFNIEDVTQDLILLVAKKTDNDLKGNHTSQPYVTRRNRYFQELLQREANETRILPEIVPEQPISVEETVLKNELNQKIKELMSKLSPRESYVLGLKFGLIDEKQSTFKEIGKAFNVSGSRANKIALDALRTLKKGLKDSLIR